MNFVCGTHRNVFVIEEHEDVVHGGDEHDGPEAFVDVGQGAEFPGQGSVAHVNVPLHSQRQRQPHACSVKDVWEYLQQIIIVKFHPREISF